MKQESMGHFFAKKCPSAQNSPLDCFVAFTPEKSDGLKRFSSLRWATRGVHHLASQDLFEKSSIKNF